MTGVWVLLAIGVELACIVLVRRVARAKGWTPGNWGLAALLLGPAVLLIALVVPRRREPVRPQS